MPTSRPTLDRSRSMLRGQAVESPNLACDLRFTAAAEARPDQPGSLMFWSNLVKVHHITTNKPLDIQSWQDVREIADKVLAEARHTDRATSDEIEPNQVVSPFEF